MKIEEIEKALMPMNALPPVGSLYHYNKTVLKTWFCYFREEGKHMEIIKSVAKWYGKNGLKFPTYREFSERYREFAKPTEKPKQVEEFEPLTDEEREELKRRSDEIFLNGNLKFNKI